MNNKINTISIGENQYELNDKETSDKVDTLQTTVQSIQDKIDSALESNDPDAISQALLDVKSYIGERTDALEQKIDTLSLNSSSLVVNDLYMSGDYKTGQCFVKDSYSDTIEVIDFSYIYIKSKKTSFYNYYNSLNSNTFLHINKIYNIAPKDSCDCYSAVYINSAYLYFRKGRYVLGVKDQPGYIEGEVITEFGNIPFCISVVPDSN